MTTTTTYTELEIGLHRTEPSSVRAEFRFDDPTSEAEIPAARGTVELDPAALLPLQMDREAYGRTLADQLFADESFRALYGQARAVTEASGSSLRLRVRIDPSAQDLHALRWELLHDPHTQTSIAASERTLVSRFMASRDWRPVKLRPKDRLGALVAVAAPNDVERYRLARVDGDGEIDRARRGLEGVNVEVLGQEDPLTLGRLLEGLRRDPDILYLVCHGVLARQQEPYLLLQDELGHTHRTRGEDLVRAIAELRRPPRLIVLASCESAGTEGGTTADGQATAQMSLAPRLAEAGVPAILAMQGKISMQTVASMMPIFFRELLVDGQIDRALAVARGQVRDRDDSWMPVLYLRLKRGRIWYVPGFSGDGGDFSKWRSIASSVIQGSFVPILGPEVGEHVYGSMHRVAQHLSQRHGFPLAAQDRGDLAKVTQYVSVRESRMLARDEVLEHYVQGVIQLHPELAEFEGLPLPKLLDRVVQGLDPEDPFRILAELPAKVYVNACPDPLLIKALKAAGRDPQPLLCEWRPTPDRHPTAPTCSHTPSAATPIVHHVFGVLGKASSLVMTEDDFFDYLIATAEFKLMPGPVRGALTRGSLLFLGFRLDDWTFRILFRLIMALGGQHRLRDYAHVGVQVDPEGHDLADLEEARRYLDEYFGAGRDAPPISIFWGTSKDFLEELQRQMNQESVEEEPVLATVDDEDWLS